MVDAMAMREDRKDALIMAVGDEITVLVRRPRVINQGTLLHEFIPASQEGAVLWTS
jgi:hypothetical protein